MARTYDDPCGLARALNLVGDRWALLVVRELLLGPKRFSDLRRGLPGASQSMLTQRLTELEHAGVLGRRQLGPPTSTWVYELTESGHALAPALLELARWGSRTPLTSTVEMSVDALALALRTTFDAAAAGDLRARCSLVVDGDRLVATVEDGRFGIVRAEADAVDAELESSAAALRALVFTDEDVATAEAAGRVTVRGCRVVAARFLTLFPRPTPTGPHA
ncbi:winged helix-turn-helix transcriptional regulator [Cryptosporangium minutisporangium]|uniref:winged helix-turn-helix transcriptional regulator n=1 Tax=Cryptosporangium minutisporangium TaxID=113569 RepID=UPI0035F03357